MKDVNKIEITKGDVSLSFLFWSFLKIGATSFGGFMALISVVQKHLVEKEKIISDKTVLDAISLASVLPGPIAFNVIVYIGYHLKGIKGALVSMLAILLPSFIFMLLLSFVYVEYGHLPLLNNFFKGVLPAVAAIVMVVAINMAKKHIKDYKQVIICVLSVVALLLVKSVFTTFIIIIGGGFLGFLLYKDSFETSDRAVANPRIKSKIQLLYSFIIIILVMLVVVVLPLMLSGEIHELALIQKKLMLTFSTISVSLFGGGYVIIPTMQEIIVDGMHWLSNTEFADAIAMGQLTPGPIFISATFIGYKVGGFLGAVTATLAVFVPPAFIMIFFSEFLNRVKDSVVTKAAFKGLRPAVIGMIFSSSYILTKDISVSWFSVCVFLAVLVASLKYKIDVVYLIPLSGVAGMLFFYFN